MQTAPPAASPELLRRLRAIVGAEHVREAAADRAVYSYDASVYRGLDALAVAYPRDTEQVAALVRLARSEGLPVIARGAGTGINGGALPAKPALVIALTRMDRVLEVDPDNRVVVVEPGVVNQDLKAHLAALGYGFNYVPDPGSQVVSTIGGNVGNNAGGMHCLKYGVTSNHVLGVEVVLPDGEIVELGGPVLGRPGMDLTGLMVGSEGTLGIVTKVCVRILPLPEQVVTQLALFPTVEHAANAVSGIMAAGILPAALELLDKKMMDTVDRHVHVGYPKDAGASLIIEMDGLADGMELELRRVREVCQANAAIDLQTAQSEEEAGKLWLSRRAAYGSMARFSHTVYVMDVAVPRNLLAEAIRRVVAICDELKLDVVTLAHAGDGNLHPLIPFDASDPHSREAALQAHHRIMEMCVAMGGSITGEHGVGVEKQNELDLMYRGDDLRMMFAVKEALDPADLLNPRKVFPVRLFDARDAARPVAPSAKGRP
jgi:glycolate dehydrogenase FAD-linked subunit